MTQFKGNRTSKTISNPFFLGTDGEMWICKPTGMNQGKGIFLIRNREELLEKLGPKVSSSGRQRCFPSPGKVVQRYPICCRLDNREVQIWLPIPLPKSIFQPIRRVRQIRLTNQIV